MEQIQMNCQKNRLNDETETNHVTLYQFVSDLKIINDFSAKKCERTSSFVEE